jgi:hypothetical protein
LLVLGEIPAMEFKDLFISYNRGERERVHALALAFESLGLTVWFDARLEPGITFDEEIAQQLKAARCVVVCWSAASVSSRWVRSEAHLGADLQKLVPLFLEPCELPPPFNLDHTEDLTDWHDNWSHVGFNKILRRIGMLTQRGDALTAWAKAWGTQEPNSFRRFLQNFPSDVLVTQAKERIWSLESSRLRKRLVEELHYEPSDAAQSAETSQQILRLEADLAGMQSALAEASVRERELQHRLSASIAESVRQGDQIELLTNQSRHEPKLAGWKGALARAIRRASPEVSQADGASGSAEGVARVDSGALPKERAEWPGEKGVWFVRRWNTRDAVWAAASAFVVAFFIRSVIWNFVGTLPDFMLVDVLRVPGLLTSIMAILTIATEAKSGSWLPRRLELVTVGAAFVITLAFSHNIIVSLPVDGPLLRDVLVSLGYGAFAALYSLVVIARSVLRAWTRKPKLSRMRTGLVTGLSVVALGVALFGTLAVIVSV